MNEIDRAAEIKAVKSDILRSLHCSLPGHILAFDSSACKAQIQLIGDHMPILKDVPVFMPVKLNVQVDDPCLVVFSDRDITDWLLSDDITSSPRLHSLSDGIAFVGFGNPDGIGDYYTKHEVSDLISNKLNGINAQGNNRLELKNHNGVMSFISYATTPSANSPSMWIDVNSSSKNITFFKDVGNGWEVFGTLQIP